MQPSLSLKKVLYSVSELEIPGPIDQTHQTPGTPGSDKNDIHRSKDYLILVCLWKKLDEKATDLNEKNAGVKL